MASFDQAGTELMSGAGKGVEVGASQEQRMLVISRSSSAFFIDELLGIPHTFFRKKYGKKSKRANQASAHSIP